MKSYIRANEGLRLKPYKCSANRLTIGYGRNLDDIGITKDEAEMMLTNDTDRCLSALSAIFGDNFLYKLSHQRKVVLVDMMYNLGKTRFLTFKKMIQAVKDKDFNEASVQLLDSKYARQLPERSERNAGMMRISGRK